MGNWQEGGKVIQKVSNNGSTWTAMTRARIKVDQSNTDTQSTLTITGQARSGNDAGTLNRLDAWGIHVYAGHGNAGGVAGRETSTYDKLNMTNWVGTVTCTDTFPRQESAYTVRCYVRQQASDMSAGTVWASPDITIPALPIQVPPNVSDFSVLTDSENSNFVLSWTNNGSGPHTPTINIVDVQINDGEWVNIYNGNLITSTTYQMTDNNKYKFRVLSGNSAGNSSYVESNIIYTKPEKPKLISGNITSIDNKYILKIKTDFSDTNYPTSLNISFVKTSTGEVIKTSTIDDQKIIEAKINNYELVINKDIQPDDANYSLLQAILAAKRKESSLTLQAKTLIDYQEQNLESDNTTYEILNIKYIPSILFKIPTDKTISKEQKEDIAIDYETLVQGMPIYFSVPEEQNTFSFDIFNIEGTLNSLEGVSLNVRKKSEVTSTYTQQIYNESLQDTSSGKTVKITNLAKGDYLFELFFDRDTTGLPGFDFSFKSNLTYTTLVAPSIQSIYARIPDITKQEEKTETLLADPFTLKAKAEQRLIGEFEVLPNSSFNITYTRSKQIAGEGDMSPGAPPAGTVIDDGGMIQIVNKNNEEDIIGEIFCEQVADPSKIETKVATYTNNSETPITYLVRMWAESPHPQFTIDKMTVTKQVIVPYRIKDLLFPVDDSYITA